MPGASTGYIFVYIYIYYTYLGVRAVAGDWSGYRAHKHTRIRLHGISGKVGDNRLGTKKYNVILNLCFNSWVFNVRTITHHDPYSRLCRGGRVRGERRGRVRGIESIIFTRDLAQHVCTLCLTHQLRAMAGTCRLGSNGLAAMESHDGDPQDARSMGQILYCTSLRRYPTSHPNACQPVTDNRSDRGKGGEEAAAKGERNDENSGDEYTRRPGLSGTTFLRQHLSLNVPKQTLPPALQSRSPTNILLGSFHFRFETRLLNLHSHGEEYSSLSQLHEQCCPLQLLLLTLYFWFWDWIPDMPDATNGTQGNWDSQGAFLFGVLVKTTIPFKASVFHWKSRYSCSGICFFMVDLQLAKGLVGCRSQYRYKEEKKD